MWFSSQFLQMKLCSVYLFLNRESSGWRIICLAWPIMVDFLWFDSYAWFTFSSQVLVETFGEMWMRQSTHECRHSHSCARIVDNEARHSRHSRFLWLGTDLSTCLRELRDETITVLPDAQISQHISWFWEKISNDADLRTNSKISLILLLLFQKNTKNSVVKYNMIKICLLKNKLIPNENNTDSRKSIHHNVTTDHNATMKNQKKTASQKT